MFRAYRCEICGETYLGESRPENCPYCGAHRKYLKKLENYERVMPDEVTDKSRENILKAIDLEVDNAKFYGCAASETEDGLEAGVFKRLKKIEAEHAEALAEVIEVPEEEIPSYDKCSADALENYSEAHDREERAINSYRKFGSEAEEPEVKELFQALVDIETDHLKLSERKGAS